MRKQIDYSNSPEVVSSDFVGSRHACIFDAQATIVNGNQVIRVDSGASYRVADRFLLTQMQRQGASLPAQLANRTAGLLLLVISLPLWPLAATGALLKSPSMPMRKLRLRGNKYRLDEMHEPVRAQFIGREWAVSAPVLRRLPLLLAVTLSLMRPDLIASWLGMAHHQRYWTYLIGLALFGVLYLMQRPRTPKPAAAPSAV